MDVSVYRYRSIYNNVIGVNKHVPSNTSYGESEKKPWVVWGME